ncbi:MAG: hypothetical protein OXB88_08650 [Bacteriovoracales bacterium]|nr:hypothetical protein [Bacteriovoracales bacterium]
MKKANLKKKSFTLPLKKNQASPNSLRSRRVEIWTLPARDRGLEETMVEYAPFPGLHRDLDRYRRYLLSELRFLAQRSWRETPIRDIPFHPLIRDDKTWEAKAESYGPFQRIKIKCAGRSLDDDIHFFHALCRRFPRAQFRVDANRLWDEKTFRRFGERIDLSRIDYFEEPTPNALALTQDFPIALDETLLAYGERPDELRTPKALILKPHLYEDMEQVLNLIRWADQKKIPAIMSSLFNSSVGTQNLLRLTCLCHGDSPQGLDPLFHLEGDVVQNPLKAEGPHFPAREVTKRLVLKS